MTNKLDLNGKWKLRWADGQRGGLPYHANEITDESRWIDAEVPGEVHLDLIGAGIIEEPTTGTNCIAARWVEECFWSYRKVFIPSEQVFDGWTWLVFEGLDYNAVIYLNGEEIGKHSNFFYPCRINIAGRLRKGENTLVVQLESGLFGVSEKPVSGYYSAANGPDLLLHKRIWMRKPQCSFGWDWSTRLINIGIHGQVYLEWAQNARVDQFVVLSEVNEDFSKGFIKARLFVEGLGDIAQKGKLFINVEETGKQFSCDVEIKHGMQMLELCDTIESPELWWPVNQGAQSLYSIHASLFIDGVMIGETTRKVGFRKVKINQDAHPDGGNYFCIEVNNRKIFAKGANFVPADMIFSRIDKNRYEILVDRAVEANFNFLRVWGGGLYESDDFYEICDQKGILVWQEFIFACATYPATDENFTADLKKEFTYNIRRLANHASLIAWCGNNEQQWQTYNQEKGILYPDYAIYNHIIPLLLRLEDPGRYYQPSSPMSPDNEFPNRDDMGDQHPWSIGFENIDFREYRKMSCRFPNEGGILGPTSLPTVHACLPEGQKFLHSFGWQLHDNTLDTLLQNTSPDRIVKEWLNLNPKDMSIEEYVYYAGLLQGEGLREYIDNFRRRKYDNAAAIFWMYNDCWPAVRSWTIIDFYLNRTPSFYPVKRAFSPISIVVVREYEKVRIFGINEMQNTWMGRLRYGIFFLDGRYVIDESCDVELPLNSSTCLVEFDAEKWDAAGINKTAAFAMLTQGEQLIARNRLFLPKFCEIEWPEAEVLFVFKGDFAVFSSSNFVWGVCLDLDGEDALADNFFDLWPGMEYRLGCLREKNISIIRTGNLHYKD